MTLVLNTFHIFSDIRDCENSIAILKNELKKYSYCYNNKDYLKKLIIGINLQYCKLENKNDKHLQEIQPSIFVTMYQMLLLVPIRSRTGVKSNNELMTRNNPMKNHQFIYNKFIKGIINKFFNYIRCISYEKVYLITK